MKSLTWKIALMMLAAIFLFACGGEKGEVGEKTDKKAPEMSPQELGKKIATVYAAALEEVTTFLLDKPDVDKVREPVAQMKEEYIMKLFSLGQKREAFDEAGRRACDSAILMEFDERLSDDWFPTFSDISQHYFEVDQDFYDLVQSFNIIGQYANFDLLKKQEPGEAERLGIVIEE